MGTALRTTTALIVVLLGLVTRLGAGETLQEQRQALLEQKVALLKAALRQTEAFYVAGGVAQNGLSQARMALFEAELAAATHAPDSGKLRALLQQKVHQQEARMDHTQMLFGAGRVGLAELRKARIALLQAQLAAAADAPERAKFHTKLIAIREQDCRVVEAEYQTGRAKPMAVVEAKLVVIQAKIDKERDAANQAMVEAGGKSAPPAKR